MDSFTSSVIGKVSSFAASLINLGGIASYPGPLVESMFSRFFYITFAYHLEIKLKWRFYFKSNMIIFRFSFIGYEKFYCIPKLLGRPV